MKNNINKKSSCNKFTIWFANKLRNNVEDVTGLVIVYNACSLGCVQPTTDAQFRSYAIRIIKPTVKSLHYVIFIFKCFQSEGQFRT